MSKYAEIDKAKVFVGGVYFQPGLYLVRIDAVKEGQSRKKEDFFAVECTVQESNVSALGAGKMATWMVMLKQDAALSNIKQFASVVGECDADEVDAAAIDMMVASDNPMRGNIVGVEATLIKTRAGEDFTKVIWISEKDAIEKLKTAGVNVKSTKADSSATSAA